MPCFRELRENADISRRTGACSLGYRKIQLSKQYFSKLRIGVDVELNTSGCIDLLLHLFAPRLKALLQRREQRQVDRYSSPFHLGQHVDKGYFHTIEQSGQLVGFELRFEYSPHL